MKKRRKGLSIIVALAMVLTLMPWMSLTAKADAYEGNPYALLVNTTTKVKFNDIDWYGTALILAKSL